MKKKVEKYMTQWLLLLIAVLAAIPVCGQTFSFSYITYADSLGEVPLEAEIEYSITDPVRQLVSVTAFYGSFNDLVIPARVVYDSLEFKVTEIGEYVFAQTGEDTVQTCNGSLFLPEDISTIGHYAFQNVDFNVIMPDGVREIGQGAFAGCRRFVTAKLPDKLEIIGQDAFRRSGLSDTVFIPNSVMEIGSSAFAECDGLEAFDVDSHNQFFGVVDGILYDVEGAHLIQYPGGKTDSCFVVPFTVTDVEDAAFAGCPHLHSVSFSNNDTSLWKEGFLNCKGLETVDLPSNLGIISDGLFSGCSLLKEVYIPENVSLIGQKAFLDCSSLMSVTIPNDVLLLGKQCFGGCNGLQWVKAYPILPPMMEEDVFSVDSIPLYLHYASLESYRQSDQWPHFFEMIPFSEVYAEDMCVYPLAEEPLVLVLETSGLENLLFDTIEFSLTLPEGFSLASDTLSGVVWELPAELPDGRLNVEITNAGEGHYHFVVRAEEGKYIKAGHFNMFTLKLCADSLFEDVSLPAFVSDGQVRAADVLVADLPSSSFSIQVENLLTGDVNFDSRQNVVDVMSIVSHILDDQVPIREFVADVNQDSVVDIVDVMKLVQIIMSND